MTSRNDLLNDFTVALQKGPEPTESSWAKGALAVLDANVMLDAYELKRVAIAELQRAFAELASAKRLIVPRHAYLEFLFNRSRKVAELHKQISAQRSRLSDIIHPLATQAAIFPRLQTVLDNLRPALGAYQTQLGETLSEIASWSWDDPIARMYQQTLAPTVYTLDHQSAPPLLDAKTRAELEIPPGYKDKQKKQNADGDFEIWKSIIAVGAERKCDVIFVTNETKSDWYVAGADGLAMPRYELLLEFRQITGHHFHIVPFDKFLNLAGAKPETVNDARRVRTRRTVVSSPRLLVEAQRLIDQTRKLATQYELRITKEQSSFARRGSPLNELRKHAVKLEDLSMEIMAEYNRDLRAKVELVHSALMDHLDESEPAFDLPIPASSPMELRAIGDALEGVVNAVEESERREWRVD